MTMMAVLRRPRASTASTIGGLLFLALSFLPILLPDRLTYALITVGCYAMAAISVLLGREPLTTSGRLDVDAIGIKIGNVGIRRDRVLPGWTVSQGDQVSMVLPLRGWYNFRNKIEVTVPAEARQSLLCWAPGKGQEIRLQLVVRWPALLAGLAVAWMLVVAMASAGLPIWLRVHAFFWLLLLPALAPGRLSLDREQLRIREWYGVLRTIQYRSIVSINTVTSNGHEPSLELLLGPAGSYRLPATELNAAALAELIEARRDGEASHT
jgi:hypothetical protein